MYRYVPEHIRFLSHHDAAVFLDAWLINDLGWLDAVGTRTMFRIPRFDVRWNALLNKSGTTFHGNRSVLQFLFRQRALSIAGKFARLPGTAWCDSDFGAGQLTAAIANRPLGFDKAIVIASTFNELAVENGIGEVYQVGAHEIAACVFWFADLYGWFQKAIGSAIRKNQDQSDVMRLMSDFSGQSSLMLTALIGQAPNSVAFADLDKAAKWTASYRTLRAILKALAEYVPDVDEVGLRDQRILRKAYTGANKRAQLDESIEATQRITKPPYGWPPDGNPWDDYPPDPVVLPGGSPLPP